MYHRHISRISILACCFVLMSLLSSCRKEALVIESPNTRRCTTYLEQFEAVWQGIDHLYVLWERDTVDWDARYKRFRPVFEAFDARGNNNPVDSAEYHQAWINATKGLLDRHMGIFLYNPHLKKIFFVRPASNSYSHQTDYRAQIEVLKRQPGISDFVEYYKTPNKFFNSAFCMLPGKTSGNKIAYFRFDSFSLTGLVDSQFVDKNSLIAPLCAFYGDKYWDGITNGAPNSDEVESIIIDLRGNPGGNANDIKYLIGCLMQDDFHYGYSRLKEGLGRLDYTVWNSFWISSPKNHINKVKPIVVLTDINSVSCSELSTHTLKSLPNVKVIGERTFGGFCAVVPQTDKFFDVLYSGCFGDHNLGEDNAMNKITYPNEFGHFVYCGTFDVVTTDYKSLEGEGVKPDIEVLYNASALASGTDPQLERALQYLRTGK